MNYLGAWNLGVSGQGVAVTILGKQTYSENNRKISQMFCRCQTVFNTPFRDSLYHMFILTFSSIYVY